MTWNINKYYPYYVWMYIIRNYWGGWEVMPDWGLTLLKWSPENSTFSLMDCETKGSSINAKGNLERRGGLRWKRPKWYANEAWGPICISEWWVFESPDVENNFLIILSPSQFKIFTSRGGGYDNNINLSSMCL